MEGIRGPLSWSWFWKNSHDHYDHGHLPSAPLERGKSRIRRRQTRAEEHPHAASWSGEEEEEAVHNSRGAIASAHRPQWLLNISRSIAGVGRWVGQSVLRTYVNDGERGMEGSLWETPFAGIRLMAFVIS